MAGVVVHLIITIFIFSRFSNVLCRSPDSQSSEPKGYDDLLIIFKESLHATFSWKEGDGDLCEKWEDAIKCDEEKSVVGIDLSGRQLTADGSEINASILQNISTLQYVDLSNNNFSGSIPGFNNFTQLKGLNFSYNRFSSEIPADYFKNMDKLWLLDLSNNNFSGLIPSSLETVPYFKILYLANNNFTGRIPNLKYNESAVPFFLLNLSRNNLQGEIPESISSLPVISFEENPGLCGYPLAACPPPSPVPPPNNFHVASPPPDQERSNKSTKFVMLTVLLLVLLWSYKTKRPIDNEEPYFKGFDDDDMIPVLEEGSERGTTDFSFSMKGESRYIDIDGSNHLSERAEDESSRKDGEIVMVNERKGTFGMHNLMQAVSEFLGRQGLGTAYRSILPNGLGLVVKRYKEMEKLNKTAFHTELRRLGGISHPNVLPPLAYFYEGDETLIVYEYIRRGSVMSVLHGNRGVTSTELDWPVRLKIIRGIAKGLGFLHTEFSDYELPHGNLKSSNILLTANDEPLLTDYALYQLIGETPAVQKSLFAYKCPEAELHGYLSPKCDVYCLGVVVLEIIITGEFPSYYLNGNQKDGLDLVQLINVAITQDRVEELIDPEISSTVESLESMVKMLYIAAAYVEADHLKRPAMREAIRRIDEVGI